MSPTLPRLSFIFAAALGLGTASLSFAADPAPSPLAAAQKATSPQQALDRLLAGNARFAAGVGVRRNLAAEVRETASGQYPVTSIVTCLDSRTAPEHLFDLGIGEAFVARVAGNFVNEDILGSLEFAHKAAGAKLIVVLGHSACGAVKGACDDVKLGNLTAALAKIRPAVAAVADDGSPRNSKNSAFVEKVASANVRLTVQNIRERSPVLREMLDAGQIGLVGGMYDLATGRVSLYADTAVNVKLPSAK
ncbi:MAG: hypothetical protein RLZZ15_1787 [Verrucomicrobiota bacterium]